MRIRLRVLGGELATPIEQEFAVETMGDRLSQTLRVQRLRHH